MYQNMKQVRFVGVVEDNALTDLKRSNIDTPIKFFSQNTHIESP